MGHGIKSITSLPPFFSFPFLTSPLSPPLLSQRPRQKDPWKKGAQQETIPEK